MDRQQAFPVGEREVYDRVDDLDPGIADQHVDPAIFCHCVGDAFLDRGLIGHVHADRKGIRAFFLNLSHGRVRSVEIEVGDNRSAALGGEVAARSPCRCRWPHR